MKTEQNKTKKHENHNYYKVVIAIAPFNIDEKSVHTIYLKNSPS